MRIMPQKPCGIILLEEAFTAQFITLLGEKAYRVLDMTKRRDNSTVAAL
jgi:hypothetical protein